MKDKEYWERITKNCSVKFQRQLKIKNVRAISWVVCIPILILFSLHFSYSEAGPIYLHILSFLVVAIAATLATTEGYYSTFRALLDKKDLMVQTVDCVNKELTNEINKLSCSDGLKKRLRYVLITYTRALQTDSENNDIGTFEKHMNTLYTELSGMNENDKG